jgi:hypothetical protein
MVQDGWIEHHRADGELLGWIRPQGNDFVPVDLLGRELSVPTDWLTAESTLDDAGIGYLADPFELRLEDGTWQRVRVIEVTATTIRLKREDFGAIGGTRVNFTLPFPSAQRLRSVPTTSTD